MRAVVSAGLILSLLVAPAACRSTASTSHSKEPAPDAGSLPVSTTAAGPDASNRGASDDLSEVDELALNFETACARTHDGRVACWGSTIDGTAGLGSEAPYGCEGGSCRRAHWIKPLAKTQKLVLGGSHFGCALDTEGTVRCWGANNLRQLGIGASPDTCTSEPLDDGRKAHTPCALAPQVQPTDLAVTALSTGNDHGCVATKTGSVFCWGATAGAGKRDDECPWGTGDPLRCNRVPRHVDGVEGVVEVASGSSDTCARTSAGAIWCWGFGDHGELGEGNPSRRTSEKPVKIVGITSAERIVTNRSGFCVVEKGGVLCWGETERGKLGDGTPHVWSDPTGGRAKPSRVRIASGLLTDVRDLWASSELTCAQRDDGVYCWGHLPRGLKLPGVIEDPCPSSKSDSYCDNAVAIRVAETSVRRLLLAGNGGACVLDADARVHCTRGIYWGGGDTVNVDR